MLFNKAFKVFYDLLPAQLPGFACRFSPSHVTQLHTYSLSRRTYFPNRISYLRLSYLCMCSSSI